MTPIRMKMYCLLFHMLHFSIGIIVAHVSGHEEVPGEFDAYSFLSLTPPLAPHGYTITAVAPKSGADQNYNSLQGCSFVPSNIFTSIMSSYLVVPNTWLQSRALILVILYYVDQAAGRRRNA
jgi:hypothetical protein